MYVDIHQLRRKNDILLKSAFEEAFSDLLRFFFDDADSLFDIEKGFEFMDKELHELFPDLEKQGGSRFVDIMFVIVDFAFLVVHFDRPAVRLRMLP